MYCKILFNLHLDFKIGKTNYPPSDWLDLGPNVMNMHIVAGGVISLPKMLDYWVLVCESSCDNHIKLHSMAQLYHSASLDRQMDI